MIKTTALKLINPEPMMVTWDLGRRCNLDCTYCEASRHNNTSPHSSLDILKTTFDFIKTYTDLYNEFRVENTSTNIDFTGGEPTNNPNFWDLCSYIKNNYSNFKLGLTTNGTWHKREISTIIKYIGGLTVSYHAESHPSVKTRVINNILELANTNIWMQVNVMLHTDFFDEAVELCNLLKEKKIKYNPVPIGDGTIARSGWFSDSDGKLRRTSHPYTDKQKDWFWNHMGITNIKDRPTEGSDLGRKCCGNRCMQGKIDNDWQTVKLVENKFYDWYCAIDWFFMHIDQETGEIYHHQTCKALPGKQIGSIGNLKSKENIIASLKQKLKNPISPIICPNQRCGCGMCVPKAKKFDDFQNLWSNISNLKINK